MFGMRELLSRIDKKLAVTSTCLDILNKEFNSHKLVEEAWQVRIEGRLTECPREKNIDALKKRDDEQNGKIDRIEVMVAEIKNRATWKTEVLRSLGIAITTAIAIAGLFLAFNKDVKGEELLLPQREVIDLSAMDIDSLVDEFNNSPATDVLKFEFACHSKEDEYPVLSVYTHKTRGALGFNMNGLRLIAEHICYDWFAVTCSKLINIYGVGNELLYIIDSDGVFRPRTGYDI